MNRIVIIGNSIAAVKAVEKIKERDASWDVIHFPIEGHLPYLRHLLSDLVSRNIKSDQIYYQAPGFYSGLSIRQVMDQKPARINARKNYIATEEKAKYEYDVLILADTGADRLAAIKGNTRTGVFNIRRLADVQQMMKNLPMAETAVIQVPDARGWKMALALHKSNKEVVFVLPGEKMDSLNAGGGSWDAVKSSLEQAGVRCIENQSIAEILGNGDVKAVRLNGGKVFAAEMIVLCPEAPDLRLLKDSGIVEDQGLKVDARFHTGVGQVYALDYLCRPDVMEYWENDEGYVRYLETQGEIVARSILGENDDLGRLQQEMEGLMPTGFPNSGARPFSS